MFSLHYFLSVYLCGEDLLFIWLPAVTWAAGPHPVPRRPAAVLAFRSESWAFHPRPQSTLETMFVFLSSDCSFIFSPHWEVLRNYLWFCNQESLLVVLWGTYGMPDIEARLEIQVRLKIKKKNNNNRSAVSRQTPNPLYYHSCPNSDHS